MFQIYDILANKTKKKKLLKMTADQGFSLEKDRVESILRLRFDRIPLQGRIDLLRYNNNRVFDNDTLCCLCLCVTNVSKK